MKSKKRVWFGLGLLALAATLALWKCAPDTTGSDGFVDTGTILRIMKLDVPVVDRGSESVEISVDLKNDSMTKGIDSRTDITLTSMDLTMMGGTLRKDLNDVITPDSTITEKITIFFPSCVPGGNYPSTITVSGINDFGKDVEAEADFTISVGNLGINPILTGADGICESEAACDDVQVIPVGQGVANAICITAGADNTCETLAATNDDVLGAAPNCVNAGPDGICDTTAAATDVQAIPGDQGQPDQLCVDVGPNGLLDTVSAGDDT